MSPTTVLLRSNLRRDRAPLIALAATLFALQVLLAWLARSLDMSGRYTILAELLPQLAPDFIRNMFGFDIAVLLSFNGSIALGYFHPSVIAMLIAATVLVGHGPIGDIETRTAELLLARPVRARDLAAAALLEVAVVAIALPAAMLLGTVTGLAIVGRIGHLPMGPYLSLGANVVALTLALGAVFVFIASLSPRARRYTQVAIGYALGSYLLDFISRVWPAIHVLGPLSIFRYLDPMQAIAGQPNVAKVAFLITVAAAASISALAIFSRRDI